jgi:hypothetical protein
VEIADLAVVENISDRCLIKGVFIVEDALLKGADSVLVMLFLL